MNTWHMDCHTLTLSSEPIILYGQINKWGKMYWHPHTWDASYMLKQLFADDIISEGLGLLFFYTTTKKLAKFHNRGVQCKTCKKYKGKWDTWDSYLTVCCAMIWDLTTKGI